MKTFEPDAFIYAVKLTSVALKVKTKMFFCVNDKSENEIWQIVHENNALIREFDLSFFLEFSRCTCPSSGFTFLEDDTELTDFELRGADGSVRVHKAVLAGFSPVMKTMFSGQWKETSEGGYRHP
ncbi:hypothetical protein O0L34_g11964 [Tuta absoluta]|nr:hypothetical protein O0L34_g11964 [Tuta absoluta]